MSKQELKISGHQDIKGVSNSNPYNYLELMTGFTYEKELSSNNDYHYSTEFYAQTNKLNCVFINTMTTKFSATSITRKRNAFLNI